MSRIFCFLTICTAASVRNSVDDLRTAKLNLLRMLHRDVSPADAFLHLVTQESEQSKVASRDLLQDIDFGHFATHEEVTEFIGSHAFKNMKIKQLLREFVNSCANIWRTKIEALQDTPQMYLAFGIEPVSVLWLVASARERNDIEVRLVKIHERLARLEKSMRTLSESIAVALRRGWTHTQQHTIFLIIFLYLHCKLFANSAVQALAQLKADPSRSPWDIETDVTGKSKGSEDEAINFMKGIEDREVFVKFLRFVCRVWTAKINALSTLDLPVALRAFRNADQQIMAAIEAGDQEEYERRLGLADLRRHFDDLSSHYSLSLGEPGAVRLIAESDQDYADCAGLYTAYTIKGQIQRSHGEIIYVAESIKRVLAHNGFFWVITHSDYIEDIASGAIGENFGGFHSSLHNDNIEVSEWKSYRIKAQSSGARVLLTQLQMRLSEFVHGTRHPKFQYVRNWRTDKLG